ncbi:1868_t:CDS:2, partial [Funneliformis mosseae]
LWAILEVSEPQKLESSDNQMKHSRSSMNTSTGEKYFWCLLLLPQLIPQIFTYLSKFTIEDRDIYSLDNVQECEDLEVIVGRASDQL